MKCNEEWGTSGLPRISECSVMRNGARLGYPGYQNAV